MRRYSRLLIILVLFLSCDLAEHLRHMEPPEILAVTPGGDYAEPEAVGEISLLFSAEMDRLSVESVFGLSEDDTELDGFFLWKNREMTFHPYYGISSDKSYGITLKKSAEDIWGNSLEWDFYHRFFTGKDQNSPFLTGSDPEDYALLEEDRTPLCLYFSETMNKASFPAALSISPSILMSRQWNSGGDGITLIPLEDYERGTDYSLTLSESLEDPAGNPLNRPVELIFRRAALDEPQLLELTIEGYDCTLESENDGAVNSGLEKDLTLEGLFSAPLDIDQRSSIISLQPSRSFDLSWNTDNTCFSLSFTEYLHYGESYRLCVGDECFILLVDGENSRPPEISAVVFCPDAGIPDPQMTPLSLNSSLAAVDSTEAFFDFYLEHSPGASISLSGFMEALSLESGVMFFDYTSLEGSGEGLSPPPFPLPGEDESIIRLRLEISGAGPGGTLLLGLDSSLNDSFDNSLEENWSLTVCQP